MILLPSRRLVRGFAGVGTPSGGGSGTWDHLPSGLPLIARWRDDTTLTPSPWTIESNPYRSWTQADLGTLTVTANSIASATADFRALGAADETQPQYVEWIAGGQAANQGVKVLLQSVSVDGHTLHFAGTPFTAATETSFTLHLGWGIKDIVTTGLPGTPTMGTTRAIRTLSPGGVRGGYDPGRMLATLPSSATHFYFGAALQWPTGHPHTENEGGGKYLFFNFSDERYFVNLDLSTSTIGGLFPASPGRFTIYRQSTRVLVTAVEWVPDAENKLEWELQRRGAGSDLMRLWVNGTLALDEGALTFPAGTPVSAQFSGSNNGNRIPPSVSPDPRLINNGVTSMDAIHYATELYVAAA